MNPYKPKVKAPDPFLIGKTTQILRTNGLNTVCEAAACPNRAECYAHKTATVMILGSVCTRACTFCHVKTGAGEKVDDTEPRRLARAVKELGLDYVVITSVDRDDLKDYGAGHFRSCVQELKRSCEDVKIELLTPDFRADERVMDIVIDSDVYKLAHNAETVERLSKEVRPQSSYTRSLKTLAYYATHAKSIIKSSLMLGLGETEKEIFATLRDLLDVGVSELSLGQYLQPSAMHHEVKRYYPQDYFDLLRDEALAMGFNAVASGILVRSSYHAKEM